jgi:uncharacterized protein YndB with AHSA1/START domain
MARIHHDVHFPATPARVYRALLDADQHAAFTGAPAQITAEPGGAFACYGGRVHGRTLELVPERRIVQAWRSGDWPEGVWSTIRFELAAEGGGTRVSFDHDAVPDESQAHIDQGWHARYWEPLRDWLASTT